jgi:transcriptional regulator with XRE-family HTH domain
LQGLNKTQLAEKLGVSKSFLSQLFAGNRFVNIEHLAKIQHNLDVNINLKFKDRESIRIKNDPKRFHISYVTEVSYTTNPQGSDDPTKTATGTL